MFRGFIVLGVAYAVGYSQGYIRGQKHTLKFESFLQDLKDSEDIKNYVAQVALAVQELAEERKKAESESEEPEVIEAEAEALSEEDLDRLRDNS